MGTSESQRNNNLMITIGIMMMMMMMIINYVLIQHNVNSVHAKKYTTCMQ